MANHKSAEKRARQSLRRQAVNAIAVKKVRTFEKKLRKALVGLDKASLPTLLKDFSSQVAKAAKKGIIPSERASRKVSRLSQQVYKTLQG